MKPGFISVPFKAESGLSESTGVCKFSQAGIVVEYESKILGLIDRAVKEVRISPDDVHDIKFKKGLWKFFASIRLRLRNVGKLSELPNQSGKAVFKIKREDFETAQGAVEFFNSVLRGDQEAFPPEHSPVAELIGEGEDKYKTSELKETQKLK